MENSVTNPPHAKAARSQQPKPKKKPVKVVYIANPVRLTATAGEFRAVVQRFTGRDACHSGADADADAAAVVGHSGFGCRRTEKNSEPGPGSALSEPGLLDPFKSSVDHEAFSSQLLEEFSAMYNNNGSSGLSGYL